MSWHVDTDAFAAYRANEMSPAMAASLEAHVVACSDCRTLLSTQVDAARSAASWSAIADRIDEPHRNVAEQVLTRIGLREHVARLVVTTPAFGVAWFSAVVVVTAMAVAAASDHTVVRGDRGSFAFLVLAPLLPVVGVAFAFIPSSDPAFELTAAAPISAFELLLVRSAAVLVTSSAISIAAGLALPVTAATTVVWLLPALGLTLATLAFARWVPIAFAASGLSALWLTAAGITAHADTAGHLISHYPPFEPVGQAGFLVLTLLAAASVVASRHSFELRSTT
jgi:hypothetical protein